MAKKKRPSLKKPAPSSADVSGCAEGKTAKRSSGRSAEQSESVDVASTSRFPPSGDIRLTVNIREDLHMRLKMEAVKRRTTVGEILEDLVEQHVKA
jgi:hypothetical protein